MNQGEIIGWFLMGEVIIAILAILAGIITYFIEALTPGEERNPLIKHIWRIFKILTVLNILIIWLTLNRR